MTNSGVETMLLFWVTFIITAVTAASFEDFLRTENDAIFDKSLLNYLRVRQTSVSPLDGMHRFGRLLKSIKAYVSQENEQGNHCTAINLTRCFAEGLKDDFSLYFSYKKADKMIATLDALLELKCEMNDKEMSLVFRDSKSKLLKQKHLRSFYENIEERFWGFFEPFDLNRGHQLSIFHEEFDQGVVPPFFLNLMILESTPLKDSNVSWLVELKQILENCFLNLDYENFKKDFTKVFGNRIVEKLENRGAEWKELFSVEETIEKLSAHKVLNMQTIESYLYGLSLYGICYQSFFPNTFWHLDMLKLTCGLDLGAKDVIDGLRVTVDAPFDQKNNSLMDIAFEMSSGTYGANQIEFFKKLWTLINEKSKFLKNLPRMTNFLPVPTNVSSISSAKDPIINMRPKEPHGKWNDLKMYILSQEKEKLKKIVSEQKLLRKQIENEKVKLEEDKMKVEAEKAKMEIEMAKMKTEKLKLEDEKEKIKAEKLTILQEKEKMNVEISRLKAKSIVTNQKIEEHKNKVKKAKLEEEQINAKIAAMKKAQIKEERLDSDLKAKAEKFEAEMKAKAGKLEAELKSKYDKLEAELRAKYEKLEGELKVKSEIDRILAVRKAKKIDTQIENDVNAENVNGETLKEENIASVAVRVEETENSKSFEDEFSDFKYMQSAESKSNQVEESLVDVSLNIVGNFEEVSEEKEVPLIVDANVEIVKDEISTEKIIPQETDEKKKDKLNIPIKKDTMAIKENETKMNSAAEKKVSQKKSKKRNGSKGKKVHDVREEKAKPQSPSTPIYKLHDSLRTKGINLIVPIRLHDRLLDSEEIHESLASIPIANVPYFDSISQEIDHSYQAEYLYNLFSFLLRSKNEEPRLIKLTSSCEAIVKKWNEKVIKFEKRVAENIQIEKNLLVNQIRRFGHVFKFLMYSGPKFFKVESFIKSLVDFHFTIIKLEKGTASCVYRLENDEFNDCHLLMDFLEDFKSLKNLLDSEAAEEKTDLSEIHRLFATIAKEKFENWIPKLKLKRNTLFLYVDLFRDAKQNFSLFTDGLIDLDCMSPKSELNLWNFASLEKAFRPATSAPSKDPNIMKVYLLSLRYFFGESESQAFQSCLDFFSLFTEEIVFGELFDASLISSTAKKLFNALLPEFASTAAINKDKLNGLLEILKDDSIKPASVYVILHYMGFSRWSRSFSESKSKLSFDGGLSFAATFRILCDVFNIYHLGKSAVEHEKSTELYNLILAGKKEEAKKMLNFGSMKEIPLSKFTSETSLRNFKSELKGDTESISFAEYCSTLPTGTFYMKMHDKKFKKITNQQLASLCRLIDGRMENFMEYDLRNVLSSLPGYRTVSLGDIPMEVVAFKLSKTVDGVRKVLNANILLDRGNGCYMHPFLFRSALIDILNFMEITNYCTLAVELDAKEETVAFFKERRSEAAVESFSIEMQVKRGEKAPIYLASRSLWATTQMKEFHADFKKKLNFYLENCVSAPKKFLDDAYKQFLGYFNKLKKKEMEEDELIEIILCLAELMKIAKSFQLAIKDDQSMWDSHVTTAFMMIEFAQSRHKGQSHLTSKIISDLFLKLSFILMDKNASFFHSVRLVASKISHYVFLNSEKKLLREISTLRDAAQSLISKLDIYQPLHLLIEEELLPLFPGVPNLIVSPEFLNSMCFESLNLNLSDKEKKAFLQMLFDPSSMADLDSIEDSGFHVVKPLEFLKLFNRFIENSKSVGKFDRSVVQAMIKKLTDISFKFESLKEAEIFFSWSTFQWSSPKTLTEIFNEMRFNFYYLDYLLSSKTISGAVFKQYHILARAYAILSLLNLSENEIVDWSPAESNENDCTLCDEVAEKIRNVDSIMSKQEFKKLVDSLVQEKFLTEIALESVPISIYQARGIRFMIYRGHLSLTEDPSVVKQLLSILEKK